MSFVFSFCSVGSWKRSLADQFKNNPTLDNQCFTEAGILFPVHLAVIAFLLIRYWYLRDVSSRDAPAIKFTESSLAMLKYKMAAAGAAAVIALIQLFSVIARGTAPGGDGVAALEVIMMSLIVIVYGLGARIYQLETDLYVCAGGWITRAAFTLAGLSEILKFQGVVRTMGKGDVNVFFIVYILYIALVWGLSLTEMFFYPTEYEVVRGPDYRALRNNVPKCELESPEKNADIFSILTFAWMSPLLKDGFEKPLQPEDIYGLADYDQSKTITTQWNPVWNEFTKRPNPSLLRAIREVWGNKFWVGGSLKLINDGAQFVGPIFLNLIITFVKKGDEPEWKGYFYAALLFVCTLIGAIGEAQYFQIVMRVGMQVRSALQNAVFKKSMYISNKGRGEGKFGADLAVNNLISSDCENIEMATRNFHILWSSPLRIFVSIYLLYQQLSWPSLVGAAFLVLMIPVQKQVVQKLTEYARAGFKKTDKRVKKEKEAVEAMQIVKCYAWENSFVEEARVLREEELSFLRKTAILGAFNMCLIFSVPVLVSSISFAVYVAAGNELTAAKAFTALALYNVLRFPLIFFPQVVAQLTVAVASLDRLEDYLSRSEVDEKEITPLSENCEPAVVIAEGMFSWGSLEKKKKKKKKEDKKGSPIDNKEAQMMCAVPDDYLITLKDISFEVHNYKLVAVIGETGSGKSSLLHAILGEIPKKGGIVQTRGSIAYVPQQAWIFNATLRENILFGLPYDRKKYRRAVEISGLRKDLKNMVAGDMTEIGERGINLSGGQKQRVSIARAVYSDRDVYLFDDPLSALDAHVGKSVFEGCILHGLKNKTRVLATNQIQFIPKCDYVIWLQKDKDGSGRIECVGTYDHLMKNHASFRRMMLEQGQEDKKDEGKGEEEDKQPTGLEPIKMERTASIQTIGSEVKDAHGQPKKKKKLGALVVKEEREMGTISWKIINAYVIACGGTAVLVILCFLWISTQALAQATNFWITVWTEDMLGDGYSVSFYLSIYVAWTLAQSIFEFISSLYFALRGIDGAQYLHTTMFQTLLRAPMRFYNETPLGRIINRLTKDQADIDRNLSRMISLAVRGVLNLVGTMVIIGVVTPFILIMFAPVLYLFWYAYQYFQCTMREVKRLDSITRSPIYAQFNQCLDGTSSIRAYRAQTRLIEDFFKKVDNNVRMYLTMISANRWLGLRLEFLGALIALAAAFVVVITRKTIAPGKAGLALSQAFAVTGVLNLVVRLTSAAENSLNAVERVQAYAEVQSEAASEIPDKDPAKSWPAKGEIRFEGVQMRYRPDLPLVLRGLTFTVKAGEKIGIVGRTGAGKSSLFVALYRLVELCGGQIIIDDIDVGTIGLSSLRKKLSIIPQDPVLFRGTVRFNMDPFGDYDDAQIIEALKRAHLMDPLEKILISMKKKQADEEKQKQIEDIQKREADMKAAQEEKGGCCSCFPKKDTTMTINSGRGYNYQPLKNGEEKEKEIKKELSVLSVEIQAKGANLSVGQRQLLCLARALLRHAKILVLDEATAAVDAGTDNKIQNTIRTEFKDCTLLTIAHRINTIIDADKVLVMDFGKVAEFDTPRNLLSDEKGIFTSLVNDNGPEQAKNLKDIAFGRKQAGFQEEKVEDKKTEEKNKGPDEY